MRCPYLLSTVLFLYKADIDRAASAKHDEQKAQNVDLSDMNEQKSYRSLFIANFW